MSYTPTVWEDGDIITVSNLNKIEQGIFASNGNVALVKVIADSDSYLYCESWISSGIHSGENFYRGFGVLSEVNNPIESSEGTFISYLYAPILDLSIDGVQAVIVFYEDVYSDCDIVGSGGVSSSLVDVRFWDDELGVVNSILCHGLLVSGSGTITITSKEV